MIYDVLNPGFGLSPIAADGTTDDKVNFQLIINHANSQGGGEIILPGNRTILISSQLTIYSNLTFRSSHGKTVIKALADGVYSFMNFAPQSTTYSVTIDGVEFNGGGFNTTHGLIFLSGANVKVINCDFKNFNQGYQAIMFKFSINNVIIKNCTFDNLNSGIFFHQRNQNLRIEDNHFNNLNGHAIHLQGSQTAAHYCSDVIIRGNHITISPQPPNEPGIHGIYMTCADTDFDGTSAHHENIIIADNTIIGPSLSFPAKDSTVQGGAADLISLKDIIRLKCYGNTARNGGDLGYAIERCHYGVVSNNTADQNNRCGISIFGSSHISVTGNVCGNNEQDYDGENGNPPYGGIRVEFDSVHVILSGNHLYGQGVGVGTQKYGIVVKENSIPASDSTNPTRAPFNIKIGVNHYSGNSLGDIYNEITSTIIQDASASVAP
ncbi:right-handed parallel beta-helix repeat-containing protein [uncultured Kordia sp.]|uniref:right-handed parallel beta-helix repeat-containing protein n=1 Tax=uncultured Kordia sp. TaxID=507699 RepID=UPI00260E2702|nr:right-handed parallel beta-helix repeat-containing protein [uncultured Kordia sp.]